MILMEWMPLWHHYQGRWSQLFPENEYGVMNLDTHIYDFKNTVQEEEQSWDQGQWPALKPITNEVPVMVGEFTLALNHDLPDNDAQGWAEYVQQRLHENNALGSAHWLWQCDERKWWSMRALSNQYGGAIDWPKVFGKETFFLH